MTKSIFAATLLMVFISGSARNRNPLQRTSPPRRINPFRGAVGLRARNDEAAFPKSEPSWKTGTWSTKLRP